MTEAEQLQDHLARLRAGRPLVTLTREQADEQALRLRRRRMTYSGIARTMLAYHGYPLSAKQWSERLRRLGVPPSKGPHAVVRGTD